MASGPLTEFVTIPHRGRSLRLEYRWLNQDVTGSPLIVFLHEGLGSVAMWRDFPARLCATIGCRGLVYSRPGYGRSTPRAAGDRWQPDYLSVQAQDVLPGLLDALGVAPQRQPTVLFGHSDGASIALINAAQPDAHLAGIVVMAPHIRVEPITLAGVAQMRTLYETTDLRDRLARFHDDADSAFHGWNDAWLDPRFADWSIEAQLPQIRCPVLAIQGVGDEYGTMAQIDGIAAAAAHVDLLKLDACGHSPHRDQPEAVIAATAAWLERLQPSIRS